METYREYPIRCKTCNEQIACFAPDYEAFIGAGYTIEQALNELGIMDYCSRIAMMNPVIVGFNMENREVIEGFRSVDAAIEANARKESPGRPIFTACLGQAFTNAPTAPLITVQPRGTVPPRPVVVQPTGGLLKPLGPVPTPAAFQTLTQQALQAQIEELGPGIPVNIPEHVITGEFIEPTMVGVPTINPNPLAPVATINVGAGKQTKVLSGRTWVAR